MSRRGLLISAGVLLIVVGFGRAGYYQAKAVVAQYLIESSWHSYLAGDGLTRPWPWADTFAVAKLSIPSVNLESYVLDGASGRNLAFGPTLVAASAKPGMPGNSVIAAHRDTHFRDLRYIQPGAMVNIQTIDGLHSYRVLETTVVDAAGARLNTHVAGNYLTLVTCYPFDQVLGGAKQRFVVIAERLKPHRI